MDFLSQNLYLIGQNGVQKWIQQQKLYRIGYMLKIFISFSSKILIILLTIVKNIDFWRKIYICCKKQVWRGNDDVPYTLFYTIFGAESISELHFALSSIDFEIKNPFLPKYQKNGYQYLKNHSQWGKMDFRNGLSTKNLLRKGYQVLCCQRLAKICCTVLLKGIPLITRLILSYKQ